MAMIFDIQAKLAAAAEKYTEKSKDIMAKVATLIINIIIVIIIINSSIVFIIIICMAIQWYHQQMQQT